MSKFADGDDDPGNYKRLEAESFAFRETHWSNVLNAGHGDPDAAAIALERLCRIYWRPIYGFIRWRRHLDHHQAEDLTQAFFQHLLVNQALKKVEREKGKFRTYLLAVLENFLSNEKERQEALKRGGGIKVIPMEEIAGEDFFKEMAHQPPALEKYYDHQWAVTLLQRALNRWREESTRNSDGELCLKLESALTTEITSAELAEALGKSVGAAKVELHRHRRRFREIVRDEVAQTVSTPEEVEQELRYLREALAA